MKIKALSFIIEVIANGDVFEDLLRSVIIRNVNGQVLDVGDYDKLRDLLDGVFKDIQGSFPSPSMSAEKQS